MDRAFENSSLLLSLSYNTDSINQSTIQNTFDPYTWTQLLRLTLSQTNTIFSVIQVCVGQSDRWAWMHSLASSDTINSHRQGPRIQWQVGYRGHHSDCHRLSLTRWRRRRWWRWPWWSAANGSASSREGCTAPWWLPALPLPRPLPSSRSLPGGETHKHTSIPVGLCPGIAHMHAGTHTHSCRQVNIRRHHWLTESSSSPGECACAVMSARPWSYPRLFLRHEGVCTHCPAYLADWFFFSYFKGPSSQMDVDSHQRFILFERHVRSSREEETRHEHARETCMSCTAPGSSRNYLLSLVGLRSAFLSIFIWLNSRSKTNVGRKNPLA